jgi:hypothetical protein
MVTTDRRVGGAVYRPMVIDLETLTEFADFAKRALDSIQIEDVEPSIIRYSLMNIDSHAPTRLLELSELQELSFTDRNRLAVVVTRAQAHFQMLVGPKTYPHTSVNVPYDAKVEAAIRTHVLTILDREGQPRMRWQRFTPAVLVLAGAVAAGLWIWLIATTALSLPAIILGWLVLACFIAAIGSRVRKLPTAANWNPVGHRIRAESRSKTYARRADEKATIKVSFLTALITAPITLTLGFLISYATDSFGLG